MNSKTLLLAGCVLLSGCTWTSAEKTAPEQFTITSHGSIFNSREALLMKINRKASQACAGRAYRLVGDQNADMTIYSYTQIGPTPSNMLSLTAYCEGSAQFAANDKAPTAP